MKIESIIIKNFRCFGPEEKPIAFEEGVTALVGGNGAGKTALLQAMLRLFGVTNSQRRVTKRDFHVQASEPELPSGAALFLEVVLSFPELEEGKAEADSDAVPEFFLQMVASAPGEPLKARMRLQATWKEDLTPEGTIDEDLRWIPTLGNEFEWDNCNKVQPVQRGSIQLIYVPASRNAADQVTALLKGRLWHAALWSDKFRRASMRSAGTIQKRFEREGAAKLVIERLAHRWQQVHEADTDTTPVLRLIESRFEDLVRRAEFSFYPDEAGQERDLADLSDGQRSLFHIALTATTLEVEREVFASAPEASPFDHEKLKQAHLTLLAIEEPENSLSPFFLSRIIGQAREIAALPTAQVVISSHSASILSRIEPEEVRYFRLDRQSRRSSVRKLTLPEGDAEARQYVRLAVRAYPELYFGRFVILGEGDSERLVIPQIAEAMGVPLDPSFVPIVPLGGRYVLHFWKLLDDLKIPHATLLDLDLGRSHGGATAIRTIVSSLREIGNDLGENFRVVLGDIDPDDIENLENWSLMAGYDDPWLQALRAEGVYLSFPVDLDFSMLRAFPAAYQHPNPGGRGPRGGEDAIREKKLVTLKTGGNPDLFDERFDEPFQWYPYLFLSRSKPEIHMGALTRLTKQDLSDGAPPELKALIKHINTALRLEDADK